MWDPDMEGSTPISLPTRAIHAHRQSLPNLPLYPIEVLKSILRTQNVFSKASRGCLKAPQKTFAGDGDRAVARITGLVPATDDHLACPNGRGKTRSRSEHSGNILTDHQALMLRQPAQGPS